MRSRPSSQSRSNATSATGILLAIRLISRSFVRFIRCWSASNEFLPSSSNATISASSTTFTWSTSSCTIRSSGYLSVTSRPFRVTRRVKSVAIVVTERIPSSLSSNNHAGSSNAFQPPSASIGWKLGGTSISGARCPEARKASQSVRVFTKWNSSPRWRPPCSTNVTLPSTHSGAS